MPKVKVRIYFKKENKNKEFGGEEKRGRDRQRKYRVRV